MDWKSVGGLLGYSTQSPQSLFFSRLLMGWVQKWSRQFCQPVTNKYEEVRVIQESNDNHRPGMLNWLRSKGRRPRGARDGEVGKKAVGSGRVQSSWTQ